MVDHRHEAERILSMLVAGPNHEIPGDTAAQMAIAHALLALGDQIAHDWEEEPDA